MTAEPTAVNPQDDIAPCKHMEGLVTSYADRTLRGPGLWYTKFHMLTCNHCRDAADKMQMLVDRLDDLRKEDASHVEQLSADRRSEMERALDAIDGQMDGEPTQ